MLISPKINRRVSLKTLSFLLGVLIFSVPAEAFDFSGWDALLKKYVSPKTISGIRLNALDYRKLLPNPTFRELLLNLEKFSPKVLKLKQEQLAFWINVYNIMAVKMVLDHYPIKSIKDVGSLFRTVWKNKVGLVGGKERTLNEIEHEILRKMNEPRIHIAIVCASVSCPDLRAEAFSADRLNTQLDDQVKLFLGNHYKGLRVENKKLYLSPIFKWFEKDFEARGGVLQFIATYVDGKEKIAVTSGQAKIIYMDYDWGLNIR